MELTSKNKKTLDIVSDSMGKIIEYQILTREQMDKQFKELNDKIDKQNILSSVKQTKKPKTTKAKTKAKTKTKAKSNNVAGRIFLMITSNDYMITGLNQHDICDWSSVKIVNSRLEGLDKITLKDDYLSLEGFVKPSAYINRFGKIVRSIFVEKSKIKMDKVFEVLEMNNPSLTVVREPKTREEIEAYKEAKP